MEASGKATFVSHSFRTYIVLYSVPTDMDL